MTSMDYTDMFKGGEELTIDGADQDDEGILSTAITTRNIDSIVEIGDESLWTINQIEALGLDCPKNELSPELIKIFGSLFREVWRGRL
jgi:hypothetical protein